MSIFYNLAGCQINPIDANFHLQNILEIFDKNSADKIWSKKDKGVGKWPPSCQLGLSIIHFQVSSQLHLFLNNVSWPRLVKLGIDETNSKINKRIYVTIICSNAEHIWVPTQGQLFTLPYFEVRKSQPSPLSWNSNQLIPLANNGDNV